jgi:transmembrane Fragile-X-F protein
VSDSKTTSSGGGIGFSGLLTIVFVIFKLLGKITWSWWWVFSPIWITAIIVIAILFILLAVVVGASLLK